MKTNFLKNVKQLMFLVVAILGTFLSHAQPSNTSTIGGTKIPGTGTDPIGIGGGSGRGTGIGTGQIDNLNLTNSFDTGGKDTSGGLQSLVIGGGKNTGGELQISFLSFKDSDSRLNDIGGKDTSGGLQSLTIGGGKSSDGGGLISFLLFNDSNSRMNDIGGKDTGGGFIVNTDIKIGGRGASDTGTGLLTFSDIGGKGTGSTDSGLLVICQFLQNESAFFTTTKIGCLQDC